MMSMNASKVWKYGDDINTDYIFPGKYTYMMLSEADMGEHAMEGIDRGFTENAKPGDVIVAGENWGCGSSREQAVKCLKARGISCVIAKSVGRIYYRNAINEGFLVIICPQAADGILPEDEIDINTSEGYISAGKKIFRFSPAPKHIEEMMKAGGLIQYTKNRISKQKVREVTL